MYKTALQLSKKLNLPVKIDTKKVEVDFGFIVCKSISEVKEFYKNYRKISGIATFKGKQIMLKINGTKLVAKSFPEAVEMYKRFGEKVEKT